MPQETPAQPTSGETPTPQAKIEALIAHYDSLIEAATVASHDLSLPTWRSERERLDKITTLQRNTMIYQSGLRDALAILKGEGPASPIMAERELNDLGVFAPDASNTPQGE